MKKSIISAAFAFISILSFAQDKKDTLPKTIKPDSVLLLSFSADTDSWKKIFEIMERNTLLSGSDTKLLTDFIKSRMKVIFVPKTEAK